MDSTALDLDSVEALIAELEVSFEELKELKCDSGTSLTNNSCCHASCYTF